MVNLSLNKTSHEVDAYFVTVSQRYSVARFPDTKFIIVGRSQPFINEFTIDIDPNIVGTAFLVEYGSLDGISPRLAFPCATDGTRALVAHNDCAVGR